MSSVILLPPAEMIGIVNAALFASDASDELARSTDSEEAERKVSDVCHKWILERTLCGCNNVCVLLTSGVSQYAQRERLSSGE